MNLSKSKYVRGLQCPKMLWMDKYMPEQAPENPNLEAIFATGNMVGDLAMQYFGDFVEVTELKEDGKLDLGKMIERTKEEIEKGTNNICEASFSEGGLYCAVDILHKNPYGWDIIEVKSSTGVHPVYYEDMTYQLYVLTKAGLNITGVYNMHLNSNYVRYGDLDLHQLFVLEDCTEICMFKQSDVQQNIAGICRYMAMADDFEPEKDIDVCCESPYECVYKGYCSRHLPKQSVFNISRLNTNKKYELYHNGIISFDDIEKKKPRLSAKQWQQVDTAYYHYAPTVDKIGIRSCVEQYTYPLYYLDFETYQPAVPPYDGIKPYMQVPFQYSLHIQNEKGGELEHREFLGEAGVDPRRALAEQLCRDIPKDVCTLAYNMSFEKTRIKELANHFPDLADHLMNIHDNIKDLMLPFQNHYYYSEALEGSYSIKKVLPALCPNDPELDYHALEGIHNGGEAMQAYPDLVNHTPEEQAVIRKNLLAYCKLDTLAMVKVLEKLYDMC